MEASPDKWWESWWFGSIIVGLGINILSSYLKPLLDQWWGKYSDRQRIKNEATLAQLNDRVDEMLADVTD